MRELSYCISSFREAAQSKDPKFDHIDGGDKEKVIAECNKAEEWFKDKKQQQDGLPKSANPVLLAAELKKKTEVLDRFCKPIMTKARPAPPKPAPTAEPKPAPAGQQGLLGVQRPRRRSRWIPTRRPGCGWGDDADGVECGHVT